MILHRPHPIRISTFRRKVVMAGIPSAKDLASVWRQQNWKRDLGKDEVDAALESGDETALQELVSTRLEFGTAGLRGKMGAGFNRMNHVVIQQTAQGLLSYLKEHDTEKNLSDKGIIVGYDGRYGSYEFACITAAVFASRGIAVHLFSSVVPTPYVAAAVSVMEAKAGVMVTASHNPKEYNGYKVYYGNGCQIIPPQDEGIAAAILQNLELWPYTWAGDAADQDPYVAIEARINSRTGDPRGPPKLPKKPYKVVGEDVDLYQTLLDRLAESSKELPASSDGGKLDTVREQLQRTFKGPDGLRKSPGAAVGLVKDPTQAVTKEYFKRLEKLKFRSVEENALAAPVVYTPLHGVGALPVKRAFDLFGLPSPHVVAEQELPDPDFPTVVFPNPEEGAGTWALAFRDGENLNSRLLLANDPDADRLAVAERNSDFPGGWQTFSGNEIGILLASWIWSNYKVHPEVQAEKCAVLASTVSSKMLAKLAEVEGLLFEETLTGFKWLGNRSIQLEAKGYKVLFAFEEALGFMFGDMFKDKDGVAAAAVFAEMAADLYASGSSVGQQLQDLYLKYGNFIYRASYFITDADKSRKVFDTIRADYPKDLGGIPILSIRDMGTGIDTADPSGKTSMPWRKGDMMITFRLEHGAILTIRASGTEPKLKYYLECSGEDKAVVQALVEKMEGAVASQLLNLERFGLKLPPKN